MDAILNLKANEIIFIYNGDKFRDREALGYVVPIKKYKVQQVNIKKDRLTEQQLLGLADRLNVKPEDLLEKQSDIYQNQYKGVKLSKGEIAKSIKNNPSLLQTPIVVMKDKAFFVHSPYDFVKFGMAVDGIKPGMGK